MRLCLTRRLFVFVSVCLPVSEHFVIDSLAEVFALVLVPKSILNSVIGVHHDFNYE